MSTIIELDERRRASLGKVGRKAHTRYRATEREDGSILLEPAVVLSERELAVLGDPTLVALIQRGVAQSHAGDVVEADLEELARFADS